MDKRTKQKIYEILAANDGCCMDDEKDIARLARALIKGLSSDPIGWVIKNDKGEYYTNKGESDGSIVWDEYTWGDNLYVRLQDAEYVRQWMKRDYRTTVTVHEVFVGAELPRRRVK